MSDTGCQPPSRIWLGDLAWFIGETARPVGMGIVLTATAAGFLMKLDVGALGVMAALCGTLYGAKAFEKVQTAKAEASKPGV